MKNAIFALFTIILLSGCSMKEFSSSPLYTGNEVKFTGAVEDRINLWPAAYYREPVGSLAWPLISWGRDHWAIRPIYSQYKQKGHGDYDEFNILWPFGQFDTYNEDYRLFPFFWGKGYSKNPYFCFFPLVWDNDEFSGVFPFFWSGDKDQYEFAVFPIFWHEKTPNSSWHSLFPLYYYKASETYSNEFWALCHLAWWERDKDGKFIEHAFLPFYGWDRGDFYSFPYSRYTDSGTVKDRILCGLLAGRNQDTNGNYKASWLFPLYYHDKDEFITPLYGKVKDASWLAPLFYNDNDLTLTPLFGKTKEASWTLPLYYKDKDKFLTLLGGRSGDTDWVVPFYWRDKKTFASLPYWRELGKDGEIDCAFSLPLLSAYERDRKTGLKSLYIFLGLGGRAWGKSGNTASWIFPLYYHDNECFYTLLYGHNPSKRWLFPIYFEDEESLLITPFYGRNKKTSSEWLLPLYYRDPDTFATALFGKSKDSSWLLPIFSRDESQINTPIFSYWDDTKKGTRGFFSLPILSGGEWKTNSYEKSWFSLAGLMGGSSNASGTETSEWAFPLFYRNEHSFTSLLYGWNGGGSNSTNTYFAAGLAGLKSGETEGGWIFPLFDKDTNADYQEKAGWMNAEKLPESIKIWTLTVTNTVWNANTKSYDLVPELKKYATEIWTHDHRTTLLVSDNNKYIRGYILYYFENTNRQYRLKEYHKLGNILAFNHEHRRYVDFDLVTRQKVSDCENANSSLFGIVYLQESNCDKMKGTSKSTQRILWRLWHREEENGNISLDVFPGYTYDSRKDGYTKTSFLWRLFRYENDPKNGKKVDFLFIPIWR